MSVRIENLTKRFGKTIAVDSVSFEVKKGEFLTLLGPSGCGKTTTLRCMAGLYEADSGHIYIDDEPVNGVPAWRRNIGLVFQNYALFPHMTVFGNLAFGLKLRKLDKSEIRARVKKILELIDLPGIENRRIRQLSGGQQQRVALARALIIEPRLLLLDEPLSNLDAKLRLNMRIEIKDIQERLGITATYVTHDQEEALSISDRIVILNKGKIEQIGTPLSIYKAPRTKFVADFIGTANILAGRVKRLDHQNSKSIVEIDHGTTLHLPLRSGLSEGSTVTVSIRPEQIELLDTRPDKDLVNVFEAEIEHRSFLGAFTRYHVLIGGKTPLIVDCRGDTISSDTKVAYVQLSPESFLFIGAIS